MRPTTSSQRSRSRLAELAAPPGRDELDPPAPDPPAPPPRGPAAPPWLEEPRPATLAGHGGDPLPEADGQPDLTPLDEPERPDATWVPERWRGARFAISPRGLVVLALLGLVVAAIAGVGVARDQPASVPVPEVPAPVAVGLTADEDPPAAGSGSGGVAGPAAAPEEIIVSVQGLVGASGLVRLEPGARVADAIAAAGGTVDGADLRSLNLAQRLADGDQVLVGIEPTDGGPPRLGSATVAAGGGPAAAAGTTGVVDLNTATVAELEELPGVGPVTAQSIVAWRSSNGRFATVDQLSEVRGIGPARLASLRELVTV